MPKRVLVVGAGLGALAGAIRLARMGCAVTVFEKNACVGGKLHETRLGGYRFDTGPSLLTMPFVIDELFAHAGQERRDFLHFEPLEPVCRYFFPDGARLDASMNVHKMKSAMAAFCAADAAAYGQFLAYSERIYRRTAELFLFSPLHEWRTLLRRRSWATLFRLHQIDPWRTVHQAVSRFFKDARLVQLFDRYATYNGSDPFRAPATLNVIPHVEYVLGSFYIRGGMYRLAEALLALAHSLNVEIHTSAEVEKILHHRGRVTGLLVNGKIFAGDCVLCGQDVVTAHDQLLDGFEKRRKQLKRLEPSCSGVVFLWGVAKNHPELAHHNIFFTRDYRREFEEIFTAKTPPQDPTVYVAITSKSDAAHAPAGGENWFVLLNAPCLTPGLNWETAAPRVRATVLRKLRGFGFEVEQSIEQEQVISPLDFYRRDRGNRGSIYGISSNRRSTAFLRPPNRSRELRGLYFAGGSTHPGGGIPLVLLSGKIAAELIAEYLRR